MTAYRMYFRTRDGAIAGRDDFDVEDDAAAMAVAGRLAEACSDICAEFELWEGVRRVDADPRRRGGAGARRLKTAEDIARHTQDLVVEREMAIRDSEWLIARSLRLLNRVRTVRTDPF